MPLYRGHGSDFRRSGGGRRACRVRGSSRIGANGCAHRPADAPAGNDRGNVVQPLDRGHRQGPSGAGNRRPGWGDGTRGGCRRDPFQAAEPRQGTGGARTSRAGRSVTLPACHAAPAGRHPEPDLARRRGRRSGNRSRRTPGRGDLRRWQPDRLRRRGADHRHISAWRHPYRRPANRVRSSVSPTPSPALPCRLAVSRPAPRRAWTGVRSTGRDCAPIPAMPTPNRSAP